MSSTAFPDLFLDSQDHILGRWTVSAFVDPAYFKVVSPYPSTEKFTEFSCHFHDVINDIDRLRKTVNCDDVSWAPYHIFEEKPHLNLCRNLFRVKMTPAFSVNTPWPIRPDYAKDLYYTLKEFDLNPLPIFDKNNSLYPPEFLQSRIDNALVSLDFDLRRVNFPVPFDFGRDDLGAPSYICYLHSIQFL
ncbi:hypothetical protein BJ165DRAFT_1524607 [Panaeolus papilionaceus]|nr:hypothetical protein BJ165DRAFT_1524607 [Panaeolus papilionaceus]